MNTIDATSANLKWLIDRLYVEGRNLQAVGVENPTFVLMTKTSDDRDKVEDMIYKWFVARYGDTMFKHIQQDARFKTSTCFTLPPSGTRVLLMDVSEDQT